MSTPYTTTRHRCDFCPRTYASKWRALQHEAICWQNPASKSCPTCQHFTPRSWPKDARCALGIANITVDHHPDGDDHYENETNCYAWSGPR